jgi:hypothetical protein
MLMVIIVSAAILVVGFLSIQRLFQKEPLSAVVNGTLNFLAALQAFIAAFGGCNAVHRAMLRDYETKMIESHRLTPMSNGGVVLGYLFGSTLQIMLVLIVVALFGAVLGLLGGVPVASWFYGNLLVFLGAVTLWSLVVFSGMRPAKPVNPAGVILAVALLGHIGLLVLPAAGLLLSVYPIAMGVALLMGATTPSGPAIALLTLLSVLLTAFWIVAAATKYRRPDLPALNASRGLILLCIWLLLGAFGIIAYSRAGAVIPLAWSGPDVTATQWATTLALSLLIALVPLNGAVECRILIRGGAAARDWVDRVPDWLVAVLGGLMICLVMALAGLPLWPTLIGGSVDPAQLGAVYWRAWLYTLAACVLALLFARGLLVVAYSFFKSPRGPAGALILATWAGPLLLDYILADVFRDYGEALTFSWLFGCSPPGTIVAVWKELPASLWQGLIPQLVLALLLTSMAWRIGNRRLRAQRAPEDLTASVKASA